MDQDKLTTFLHIHRHTQYRHTHKDTHRQRTKQTESVLTSCYGQRHGHANIRTHIHIHTYTHNHRHEGIHIHRSAYRHTDAGIVLSFVVAKTLSFIFFGVEHTTTYLSLREQIFSFFPLKNFRKGYFFRNICYRKKNRPSYLFSQKRAKNEMSSRKIKNRVPLLLARIFIPFV